MTIEQVKQVFEAHPKAETVFVVGTMPFLNRSHAQSYANTEKVDIKTYERRDLFAPAVNPDDVDTDDGPDGTGEPTGDGSDDTGEGTKSAADTGKTEATGGDTPPNGKAKPGKAKE